jgi:glycosyltransferase involved in cell wall biosynthesis
MIRLCIISTIPQTIRAFFGDQLTYLQEHDFDITIITSSAVTSQDYSKDLPSGIKLLAVKMSRTITPLDDFRAFRYILRAIEHGNFDIVQYVTPKAALLGAIASCFAKVPVRLYLMWGIYYVTQKGFKKFVFKTVEKIVCYCSTAVAPDSKGNVKFAVDEGLCEVDKISLVGHGSANGVDTRRFDPDKCSRDGRQMRSELKIPQTAKVFGCIAATVGDKGINELVEAFDEIAREYSDVYLLYIGQPTEKDNVRGTTLQTMKTNPRIIVLGWQTEPEKYLAAMDIFVLPTYREGFGVANIEASAMGLPVISTNVPGPQESIVDGQTGILVPPKEVAPLANAMRELIRRPLYARELGKAGRKRVQECYEQKELWQAIVDHRLHLISQVRKK